MGLLEIGDKDLSVYPVPATTQLTIKSEQSRMRSITIYDITGTTLHEVNFNDGVNSYVLPIESYKAGTLIIKINTENNQRIVKHAVVVK